MPYRDRQLTPPRRSPVMPHAFRVGQLVALAQTSRDPETYEVVQLMPETPSGEPQYRIKGLSSGIGAARSGWTRTCSQRQNRLMRPRGSRPDALQSVTVLELCRAW